MFMNPHRIQLLTCVSSRPRPSSSSSEKNWRFEDEDEGRGREREAWGKRSFRHALGGFSQIFPLLSLLLLSWRTTAAPMLDPIANVTLPAGKTLFVPVTASTTNGTPITYTVSTSNSRIIPNVLVGNPWLKISVSNFGDMTLQLLK